MKIKLLFLGISLILLTTASWAVRPVKDPTRLHGIQLDTFNTKPDPSKTKVFNLKKEKGHSLDVIGTPESESQIQRQVETYITKNPEKFGQLKLQQLRLDYIKIVPGQQGLKDMAYVFYVQHQNGLDVHQTGVTLTLKLLPNRIDVANLKVNLYPEVPPSLSAPLSSDSSKNSVQGRLGAFGLNKTYQDKGAKIMWIEGKWRVVHIISVKGTGISAYVDGATQQNWLFSSRHYFDVSGQVRGRGVLFDPEATGSNLDLLPLGHVPVQDSNAGTVQADAQGFYQLSGLTLSSKILSRLKGQYAEINAHQGVDQARVLLQSETSPVDVTYNPNGTNELNSALVNAYYHINVVRDWLVARGVDPPRLNDPVLTNVNIPFLEDTLEDVNCNAFYNRDEDTLNFLAGGVDLGDRCRNSAFDTIIYHEYGHLIDEAIGGIQNDNFFGIKIGDGLSEGWGDILASFITGQPLVGENFYPNRSQPFTRTAENTYQYVYSDEIHKSGQAWAGFAWDLRKIVGAELAEQLIIPVLWDNSSDVLGAVYAVAIRDDDDNDLSNGTPHFNAIVQAAINHGLSHVFDTDPFIKITAPTSSVVSGIVDVNVEFSGTFLQVDFYVDQQFQGNKKVAPYSFELNTCQFSNRPGQIQVEAIHQNQDPNAASPTTTVFDEIDVQFQNVDTTPPTINFEVPTSPIIFSKDDQWVIEAIDPLCGVQEVEVVVSIAANEILRFPVDPSEEDSNRYVFPLTKILLIRHLIDPIVYNVRIEALDWKGNSAATETFQLDFNPPPSLTIVSPQDGSIVSGVISIHTQHYEEALLLDLNFLDRNFSTDHRSRHVLPGPEYQALFSTCRLQNGPVDFRAETIVGNEEVLYSRVEFSSIEVNNNDRTPPEIQETSLQEGQFLDATDAVSLEITDNLCGVEKVMFQLKDRETAFLPVIEIEIQGNIHDPHHEIPLLDLFQVEPGQYFAEIMVRDFAGNETMMEAIKVHVENPNVFVRGDADGSGTLDVNDALFILNHVYHNSVNMTCEDASDVNDDRLIGRGDALHLLRFLFLSEAPPPPPFPHLGGEIESFGERLSCHRSQKKAEVEDIVIDRTVTQDQISQLLLFPRGQEFVDLIGELGFLDGTIVKGGEVKLVNNLFQSSLNQPVVIYYNPISMGRVTMKLYSLNGEFISTILDQDQTAGEKTINWTGVDQDNEQVGSGVYILHAKGPGFQTSQKIAVVR